MILAMESYVPCETLGEEKGLELIRRSGFDGVDYTFFSPSGNAQLGDDYMERANNTKALLKKYGLVCNQAHAPFFFRYTDGDWEKSPLWRDVNRSIEYAAYIGAKQIIIHHLNVPKTVDFVEYNLAYLRSYEPAAKKFRIRIGVENGGGVKQLLPLLEQLDPQYYVCCIDTGHANGTDYNRTAEQCIEMVPSGRLQALHINDDWGLSGKESDIHFVPFLGRINWDAVLHALAAQNYTGDFTLEIVGYLLDYLPKEVHPEALALAHAIGRLLIKKFEQIKTQF